MPSPARDDYGMLWRLINGPDITGYFAAGYGGQLIVVLPRSNAVIVVLSKVPSGVHRKTAACSRSSTS